MLLRFIFVEYIMNLNEILLYNHVIGDLENAENDAMGPAGRLLHVRERVDPFEKLSEEKFVNFFRVSKDLARVIVETVRPYIAEATRRSALSVEQKVSIAKQVLRTYKCIIHKKGLYKYMYVHTFTCTNYKVCQKVLIALKVYGFGSYQEITGTNKYLSASQPSVSRCVHEVSDALCRPEIFNVWVKFPQTLEDFQQLRHR